MWVIMTVTSTSGEGVTKMMHFAKAVGTRRRKKIARMWNLMKIRGGIRIPSRRDGPLLCTSGVGR
jgi:hypothetical protein